jgi:L,D-peptidoglycan transpeptidase YkuD (ErfK/YbiS/YcfS/YnhG family)
MLPRCKPMAVILAVALAGVTGMIPGRPGIALAGAAPAAATAPAPSCPAPANRDVTGEVMGIASMTSKSGCEGYWTVTNSGRVAAFGAAAWAGDVAGAVLARPVTAIAATRDGGGYWILGGDGHVWAFGDARLHGDGTGHGIDHPVVAIAPTADDGGYWILTDAGRVLGFGDARNAGGTLVDHYVRPAVGIAGDPVGSGYWIVNAAGRVNAFGAAHSYGGALAMGLRSPVVGIVATADGRGYWLVDAAGQVLPFGDARSHGDLSGVDLERPVVAMAAVTTGSGYWMLGENGAVYPEGSSTAAHGRASTGAGLLGRPIQINPLSVQRLAVLPAASTEVVMVEGTTPTYANLSTWGYGPYGWYQVFATMPARSGYGGWLPIGRRLPGDGASPVGLFDFGPTMYGNSPRPTGLSYPFHPLVCGDWWNEDPAYIGDGYNTFEHVPCGTEPGFGPDSEALWTEVAPYPWFAVISTPTGQPTGAGIFLHAQTDSDTAGCISLLIPDLLDVLRWMVPSDHPVIAMGPNAATALRY